MAKWTVILYDHNGVAYGDLVPEEPEFALYLSQVGYLTHTLDKTHPLASKSVLEEYKTDFKLLRAKQDIMAGICNQIERGNDSQELKVGYKDWLHYLERRQYPFDPTDLASAGCGAVGIDIFTAVEQLLTTVLSEANSLELFYANGLMGTTMDYKIDPNDTESILSKISTLADQKPGFDFEITVDRWFKMYSPNKSNTVDYRFNVANIDKITYSGTGLAGNHLLVQGAGTSQQIAVVRDSTISQGTYRRHDVAINAGDIIDETMLGTIADRKLDLATMNTFDLQLEVVPDAPDDIWARLALGDVVPVEWEDPYETINSNYRIIGFVGSVNKQGDETLKVNFTSADL